MKTLVATAAISAVVSLIGAAGAAETSDAAIDGRWDAALINNGPAVPFRLDISNTWPATVFIARDGTVRAVHSGFASPASGEFNAQLKKEFTDRIDQLLAEHPSAALAKTTADGSQTHPL